jgi:hypothetical protein
VSVVRLRPGAAVPRPLPAVAPHAFDAPAVTLFRSRPGSRYEALERLALGG